MNTLFKRSGLMVLGCGLLLAITACTLDGPTNYTQNEIEIHEKHFSQSYAVSSLNEATLQGIAQDYYKAGEGGIDITVTYDPRSKSYTARRAAETAGNIVQVLNKGGVKHVRTDILPLKDSNQSTAHISYDYLEALPPEGCRRLDEIEDSAVENYKDYELGCSTDIFLARQVAKPGDLLGRAESQDSIGRRQTNIVDGHKAGTQRGTLEGESTQGD